MRLTISAKIGEVTSTRLAFSNPADTQNRDNLTLRISFDDGKTWAKQHVVAKSEGGKMDHAAYSDLVKAQSAIHSL